MVGSNCCEKQGPGLALGAGRREAGSGSRQVAWGSGLALPLHLHWGRCPNAGDSWGADWDSYSPLSPSRLPRAQCTWARGLR